MTKFSSHLLINIFICFIGASLLWSFLSLRQNWPFLAYDMYTNQKIHSEIRHRLECINSQAEKSPVNLRATLDDPRPNYYLVLRLLELRELNPKTFHSALDQIQRRIGSECAKIQLIEEKWTFKDRNSPGEKDSDRILE